MSILLSLILAFQLIPFVKLLHIGIRRVFFLKKSTCCFFQTTHRFGFLCSVVQGLADLEYWMFPLRRYLVTFPLMIFLCIQTLTFAWTGLLLSAGWLIFFGFAVLVSLWAEYAKIFVDLKALELLKIFPSIHPSDFFKRYCIELAYGGTDFFNVQGLTCLGMLTASFRHEIRPTQSFWLTLKCLFETYTLAQMAGSALNRLGQDYFDGILDPLVVLWSKRLLERARVSLTVTGADQLFDASGTMIFISNHKSWFDFVVLLCALSDIRVQGRRLRMRFVVSPPVSSRWQHLLFHLTGLKRLSRHIPIFFSSTDPSVQQKIVQDSREKNFDLCFFPQECMALPNVDRAQKRRDAGYFATRVSAQSAGHLKSPCCEFVCRMLDAAQQAQQGEDVHVVFTALRGTANVLPSGAFRVQTEAEVNLNVGQVLTLEPRALNQFRSTKEGQDDKNREFCAQLTKLFDRELKSALEIHQSLIQHYLTELKGQFRYDDEKIDLIKDYFLECVKNGDVVFQILDATYALPVACWNPFLSHLSQLLLERASVTQLKHLFDEVRLKLIKETTRRN